MLVAIVLFAVSLSLYDARPEAPHPFYDALGSFNLMQFGKLTLLVAIFFLFERFFDVENSLLKYFAKISFGLFFIHGFYMAIFGKVAQYTNTLSAPVNLVVEFLIVVLASVGTVFVINRVLKRKSRYVIGC